MGPPGWQANPSCGEVKEDRQQGQDRGHAEGSHQGPAAHHIAHRAQEDLWRRTGCVGSRSGQKWKIMKGWSEIEEHIRLDVND